MLCVTVHFSRVASVLRSSFSATVAQDRSGDYTRITHAIAASPVLRQRRDHTKTKPGIYDEQVDVWINKTYIAPTSDDARSTTKITRSRPRTRGLSGIDDAEKQDCSKRCAEFGEVSSVLQSNFNAMVAQDRSGDYNRITHTIVVAHVLSQTRDYTKTKPGIYDEHVEVWSNKTYIALIGDGMSTTKITLRRRHARGFSGPDSTTLSKLMLSLSYTETLVLNSAVPCFSYVAELTEVIEVGVKEKMEMG
ncbi:hypothetical protein RJ639_007358 [Escallonia herrerae]|uniref:Pectinesterase catalytic domain-containing protein n=1 Tax=Escallonia herrerae TaxID=1293975 RepID=A0AA88VX71_9ASTE|nr:hypothetical protein RJ639_007358 [Escallonia herrerae]